MFKQSVMAICSWSSSLAGAGRQLIPSVLASERRGDPASDWIQRFVTREVERRVAATDVRYAERRAEGSRDERARRLIRSISTRGTLASAAAAAGASTAGVLSVMSEGMALPGALPLGVLSVVGEMLYTTALQIELAVDLANIYDVPFLASHVGELSTLLGLAAGVELAPEPGGRVQPAVPSAARPSRVRLPMQGNDFSRRLSMAVIQQSVLRNIVPIAGVVVSPAWNNIQLRRFARQVHTVVRQRRAIVDALSGVQLTDPIVARVVLDGAWLVATADGALSHQEALGLATLLDALGLPERLEVDEASVVGNEETWFIRARELDPAARRVLVDLLSLVAGADGDFTTPEARFLQRLGLILGQEMDLGLMERSVARLRVDQAASEPLASRAAAPTASPPPPGLATA